MANDFSSDSSVKALWRFESGALTVDSIGSNTLTASSSPPTTDSDHKEGAGSALLASANSQTFKITDANLNTGFPFKSNDATKTGSFCFWYKPTTIDGWKFLIGKSKYPAPNAAFALVDNGGTLWIEYGNGGSSWNDTNTSISFVAGHWYHIGCSIDSYGNVTIVVWDDTTSTRYFWHNGFILAPYITNNDFYIGDRMGPSGNYLNGRLDELVVFNRAIMSAEIDLIRQGLYTGPITTSAPSGMPLYDDFEGGNLNKWSSASGSIQSGMTVHKYVPGSSGSISYAFAAMPYVRGALDYVNDGGFSYGGYDLITFYSGSTQLFTIRRTTGAICLYGINVAAMVDWGVTPTPCDDAVTRTLSFAITPGNPGRVQIWLNGIPQIDFTGNVSGSYGTISKIVLGHVNWNASTDFDNVYVLLTSTQNLTSSVAIVSGGSAPVLAVVRTLQSSEAVGSVTSTPLLAIFQFLASAVPGVTAMGTPLLTVERSLSSSPNVVSALATPTLVVQRVLAALAVVISETADVNWLAQAIYDLTTGIAGQFQTSAPVLTVLRTLMAAIALESQAPGILLKVLRDLATAISEQSTVSTPFLAFTWFPTTAAPMVTETTPGALAVLRELVNGIAIQSLVPDMDLAKGLTQTLATILTAITQTSDIEVTLTYYESLLAKAKRYYEPISAADLEAAALQWIVAEEEKEARQ